MRLVMTLDHQMKKDRGVTQSDELSSASNSRQMSYGVTIRIL